MQGWIKLHRKMLDNPIVCKDSDHLAVWVYLLLNATHDQYPALFRGKKIMLEPGQLITGRKSISKQLVISESKVQRILSWYESEHQIEQLRGNSNRLISIVKWSEYQACEQLNEHQMNICRTSDEHLLNTNKNDKNVKELSIPPPIELVIEYCRERNNGVDPQKWYDHYTAKGWLIGKNKMKDWKAAVRTWEKEKPKSTTKTVELPEGWR